MYKIRTNGKYILLIKDLGKTLSHEDIDGATITDEEYEKSVDIKKFSRYLIIEKIDNENLNKIKDEKIKEDKVEINVTDNKVIDDQHKIFVSDGRVQTNPEDVYVKDTENKSSMEFTKTEITPEAKSEETIDLKADVTPEVKIESKENIDSKKDDSFIKVENEVKKIKKNKSSK